MPLLTIATTASDNPMGAQRYEREVIQAAPTVLPGWRVNHEVVRSVRSGLPGTMRLPMKWLVGASARQRSLLGRLAFARAGLLHRTDLILPLGPGANVVTIHDTVSWRFPDETPPIAAAAQEARQADAVICVSAFTADEVSRFLGVRDPVVVHNGVDPGFFTATPLAAGDLASLGLSGPYILQAGGASERKNLAALAEAWPRIHAEHPHLTLALAGPPHPRRTDLFAGLEGVRMLGRVPDALVAGLVAGSDVVVVPSTYEGFGLPALEAMAAGVPVVAADTTALPEVVGDAGWLVPPTADGVIGGVLDVLADLDHARTIAARGRSRAAGFTWEASARGHARVWERFAS